MTPRREGNIIPFMKILVVDDESDICYILGFELKSLGHQVTTVDNVAEAMEHLQKENYDAILCDFQMPRLNGLDLLNWMKVQKKEIPFYILTGEPTMETHHLIERGVRDILFKPQDLLRLSKIFK